MLGDLYASRGYFLAGLKGVPTIGEENGAVASNKQQTCTAGETREVKDVREMRDQCGIGPKLGKSKPEPFDAAPV